MIENGYAGAVGFIAVAMLSVAIWEGFRRKAFDQPGYRSSIVAITLIMVGSAAALVLS